MTEIGTKITTFGHIMVSYLHMIRPKEFNDTVLYLGAHNEYFWEYEDGIRWFHNKGDEWTCGWD